jgi:cytochrome b involved in lipid metabolism
MDNRIIISIDDYLFDVTDYKNHPGGYKIFVKNNGKDVTQLFNDSHRNYDPELDDLMEKYCMKC